MEKRHRELVKEIEFLANSFRVGKAFGNKPEDKVKDHAAWYLRATLQSDMSDKEIWDVINFAIFHPILFCYSIWGMRPPGI